MKGFNVIAFLRYILAYEGFAEASEGISVVPSNQVSTSAVFTREQSIAAILEGLNDSRYTWRSIKALSALARMSEYDTRELLREMEDTHSVQSTTGANDAELYSNKY